MRGKEGRGERSKEERRGRGEEERVRRKGVMTGNVLEV